MDGTSSCRGGHVSASSSHIAVDGGSIGGGVGVSDCFSVFLVSKLFSRRAAPPKDDDVVSSVGEEVFAL